MTPPSFSVARGWVLLQLVPVTLLTNSNLLATVDITYGDDDLVGNRVKNKTMHSKSNTISKMPKIT